MEYMLYIILGIIIGLSLSIMWKSKTTTVGVIQVDHKSGLCKVCITSDDLANTKCKKAVFKIDHNITIRENNNDYNE